MLAERVKEGALPPVQERIPKVPRELTPVDRIGAYGGTWNTALLGATDTPWLGRTLHECLVHWDRDWTDLVANVAEDFAFNETQTEFTFTLREGMRWSDGEPFTADDIMFWYEDVFSNETLTPVQATHFIAGGEPVVVEKDNDLQIRFVFSAPNGLFLWWLAIDEAPLMPRHYLQEFHREHNPNVADIVEAEDHDDWVALFGDKADRWANPDLPRLHGWIPTNRLGDSDRFIVERNPYYFKVDTEGSQLPYLDRITYNVLTNPETILLKSSNGEFGMHFYHTAIPANKPVYADNRENGNYSFFEVKLSLHNEFGIALNLTHKDPVKREIFRKRDFRIALSHAINRQELIEAVFQRQGTPWNIAPRPEAPFWDDGGEMGKQYTEYDPALANRYLDEAGYTPGDESGTRLGPDGNRISMQVMVNSEFFEMIDALEFIRGYWANVGIEMKVDVVDRTLWETRVDANQHDASVDEGEVGVKDAIMDPRWFFTFSSLTRFVAPLWYRWYIDDPGEKEEPPEAMRRQMALYDEELVRQTTDEGRYEIMRQIVQIAKDEFWTIGILLPPHRFGIVRNDFHNVPKSMWDAVRYGSPWATDPPQYFTSG